MKLKKNGTLVIMSGCSGVGKNTVISNLISKNSNYSILPTYTTREKRENESQGNPYYFISDKEFIERIDNDDFYEYELVHNHYYGTSKSLLNRFSNDSKVLIKDIDVKGTQNLMKSIGNDIRIISFFLYVKDKDVLVDRLIGRGEKEIDLRLSRYDMEMDYCNKYMYQIDNNNLELTIQIVESLVSFEIEGKYFKASQRLQDLNWNTVENYINEIENGVELEPIEIALFEGDWYVIDGHHRYVAAIAKNKNISKRVINVNIVDQYEQYSWEDLYESVVKKYR